jgi:hypothetical protein
MDDLSGFFVFQIGVAGFYSYSVLDEHRVAALGGRVLLAVLPSNLVLWQIFLFCVLSMFFMLF